MEIALINRELFKENGPIKEDTIVNKFYPYVILAQNRYIKRILGDPLTRELQEQIKKASDTGQTEGNITPENQALIIQIAPALSFYTVYEGLPYHWASILNKGITRGKSENSEPIAIDDVAQLKRWTKDSAQDFAGYLIEYLGECRRNYPKWNPKKGCGCDEYMRNEGSILREYDSGIYFPKRR